MNGRGLDEIHSQMNISNMEFDRFTLIFVEAMKENGFPESSTKKFHQYLELYRYSIVQKDAPQLKRQENL